MKTLFALILFISLSADLQAQTESLADSAHTVEEDLVTDAWVLHDRMITLDSHASFTSDPLSSCEETDRQVDLAKMRAGGLDAVFFSVYAPQRERTPDRYADAEREAREAFRRIHDLVEQCTDAVGLARSPEDVERIVGVGKLAVAIGIENGFTIGRDLSLLKTYRELGAVYVGLTHDGHNDIADSAIPKGELGDGASEHGGVSAFGEQVIRELNRLGIMVDVSHMSRTATLDAIRISRAPVIASHSSMHALRAHPRNIDDETLDALAAKGGVVQLVPLHSFLNDDPPEADAAFISLFEEFGIELTWQARKLPSDRRAEFEQRYAELEERWPLATVADFVDHIDHAVRRVGVDYVGIGTDFDGGGELTGWADASETLNVTVELLRRGYTEGEIRKIWGGNLLRVWKEVRRLAEDSP